MRTARDAEARNIDLSHAERAKVGDFSDYELNTELPDTARDFGIEDHVVVVGGVIERLSQMPDGGAVLQLRDGDFRVLAYVPGAACSAGSVFASQIGAVRAAVAQGALHVGDSVVVRALVFFDHVTPGGAKKGAALTPVLGVSLANGTTYGLKAISEP